MDQTRREFVKLASSGLLLKATALDGASPASPQAASASPQAASASPQAASGSCSARPRAQSSDLGALVAKPLTCDVLVAGGGLAGVCAAIGAARNGASVILVQDRSRLGGNSSSEIRMHVCGANHTPELALWRETGIIEELRLTESATNPQRSFEVWDLMLYDKILRETGVTLLLDTAVVGAVVEAGGAGEADRIVRVEAISPLLGERYDIEAKFFVDCTGDAVLAAASGADFFRGREGRDMYGESLAPEKGDEYTMGNSLLFMARKHDKPMPYRPPDWARKFSEEDFKHRPIHSWEYGYWWIEWGGELDTIRDNRVIRHELLRILLGVWDYIKNSGRHPDSANWALEWVGMIPGKRESRRVRGDHVMTQQELERAELFPDRVSYGGWPMDDHPPGGMDRKDEDPCRQIRLKQPYSIPLRSLYSANRTNLFMAGRDISASHVAFSSTRVMATCAAMGQAAGTAAAFCTQTGCMPKQIVADPNLLARLQQLLLKDDQSLLGISNRDEEDIAPKARVTCSHETEAGKAIQVIDGWNRDIGDGSTHQWQAPLKEGEPWLQLEWDAPQTIRQIQLTFDTGLHRRLFLSAEDSAYFSQTRGAQPETVADYTIEVAGTQPGSDAKWLPVAHVEGNFLRMVRHSIEPVAPASPQTVTRALRVRVHRTNGDELARIFEIRCY